MLHVDYDSWHARLYRFWYKMKHGWTLYQTDTTNLCPYMRAVLFYWWLRFLFLNGRIGRVYVAFLAYPFLAFQLPRWAGMVSYDLKIALYETEIVAVLIIAIGLVLLALDKLTDKVKAGIQVNKTIGFTRLFVHSLHNKICPAIDFEKPPTD